MSTETERFISIVGPAESAQLAEILIHQTIANQPRLETVIMEIPVSCVGRVIGAGGQTIRGLQTQSQCKIDVERGSGTRGLSEKNFILNYVRHRFRNYLDRLGPGGFSFLNI